MIQGTPVRWTRTLDPEQIALQAGRRFPALRLPDGASRFVDRELRLRQLAARHPMRDYLLFIAEVAAAQHAAWTQAVVATAAAGEPEAPWTDDLLRVLVPLRRTIGGSGAAAALARVAEASPAWLAAQANALGGDRSVALDVGAAPLLAAALQVHTMRGVLRLAHRDGAGAFQHVGLEGCPCCGSPPTASVTRIGGDEAGFRYLHCSLCGAEWHHVRIKCSRCDSTRGIHYEELARRDGAEAARAGAVRAECCDSCGHYIKHLVMEKDPQLDPVADDLASVALDLLVSEAGFRRSSVNLMLCLGETDP